MRAPHLQKKNRSLKYVAVKKTIRFLLAFRKIYEIRTVKTSFLQAEMNLVPCQRFVMEFMFFRF